MTNEITNKPYITLIVIGELKSIFVNWDKQLQDHIEIIYLTEEAMKTFHSEKELSFIVADFDKLSVETQKLLLEKNNLGAFQFLCLISQQEIVNSEWEKAVFTYSPDNSLTPHLIKQNILGVLNMMSEQNIINIDLADIITVLAGWEKSYFGFGIGKEKGQISKAKMAVEQAFSSLPQNAPIKSVIYNIESGADLSLDDFNEIHNLILERVSEEATIILGTILNQKLTNTIWLDVWCAI